MCPIIADALQYELFIVLDIPVDHMDVAYTPVSRTDFSGLHWEVTAWRMSHQDHTAIAKGDRPPVSPQSFPTTLGSLPETATDFSPPVPGLGQHWWDPADHPYGPFWVTLCSEGTRNDVIGLVYMYSEDEMIETEGGALELNDLPVRLTPNHMHFILAPKGFHGFHGQHWDLRFMFTPDEAHVTDERFRMRSMLKCFLKDS